MGEAARTGRVNIAVIETPPADGAALCGLAARPAVPIFLVTGFGVELSPEELAASGVRAVLTKPLDMHETLALLARLRRAE